MLRTTGRKPSVLLLTCLLTTLFTGTVFPQSTSSITGVIRDSSGAVIPGAEVSLRLLATGAVRHALTTDTGVYRLTNLAPGMYTVAASMAGFKTTVARIEVTVGEVAHVELTLGLGEISEQIVVSNAATPVDVEQGRVSLLVDEERIVDLPLNGRNVFQLMQLTPGAVNTYSSIWEFGQGTNVNGGRASANGFWMDGTSISTLNGGSMGELYMDPGEQQSLESVQEFRIETLNFSAEFGEASGSVVNVVSKSGGNEYHGSMFAFHRNDNLDAREFFDSGKPEFRQTQFGFSLGGPIKKESTFFFLSYEGTRQASGKSAARNFESRAWGDYVARYGRPVGRFLYSNYPAPGLDVQTASVGQYLTGSYIDSPTQHNVDKFLGETFGSPPGAIKADAPMVGETNFFRPWWVRYDGISFRIDQEIGQDHKVYGRYFYNRGLLDTGELREYGEDWREDPRTHLLTLNWTRIFSPSIVNEARVGFTRGVYSYDSLIPGLPWIGEAGFFSIFSSGGPYFENENSFTWADTVNITVGSHGLKLGGEVRRNQQNRRADWGHPSYYFYDLVYLALDDPYYQAAGVNPHLDQPHGAAELSDVYRGWRNSEVGIFFNDDWKVQPNFTLNLGVRWDWYGRLTEVQNRGTAFDLSMGNDVFERVYYGSFVGPVSQLTNDDWNNISPRFGFAWDPFRDGKMSIRGGFGIAHQSQIYTPLGNSGWNKPFYSWNAVCPVCGMGESVLYGPQNGEPVRVDGANPNPAAASYVGNIIAYDPLNPNLTMLNGIPNPAMRDPYVQSFFFGVQRELFRGSNLEVNYVGTLGRKLMRSENYNRFSGDLLGAPNPVSGEPSEEGILNRINPYEGTLRFWENSVSSNYHALQMEFDRRYGAGLAIQANYTLAKSLDTRSTWSNAGTSSNRLQEGFSNDVSNQALDYGRSVFDARHRFTVNWLWDMGWCIDSGSWVLRNVLGGWQANGIVSLQSGQPFTPYCQRGWWGGCDWNADGHYNDRPNTPTVGNSISSERSDFVNPNAGIFGIPSSDLGSTPSLADKMAYFGTPEYGTNGTLGRNTYDGPGYAGVDFSLLKEIGLSKTNEEARLQLRFEFFNLFNRVNFFQPINKINDEFFGRSRVTFDAREIQLGIKMIF